MTAPWLEPVRRVLDRRATPVDVFFRDDDAGWDDAALGRLLDVFERNGAPIDLAVIPEALEDGLADELLARHRRSGVRLHQHGFAHVNHQLSGRKGEFGSDRTVEELRSDVATGWGRLSAMLGDALDPVFTPPWNRCADALGDVLVDIGIEVLSRDLSAGRIGTPGLAEVPVAVDWFAAPKGSERTLATLADALASSLAGPGPVGIMLHHAVTSNEELAVIADVVALLVRHPRTGLTSIVELAGLAS